MRFHFDRDQRLALWLGIVAAAMILMVGLPAVAQEEPAAEPTEEEAIELANDTPFGLGSYVFSDDPEQALRVADGLDTGMVYVNGVGLDGAELPFGGVKRSGFGRELGRYGIEEFVNKKLIRVVK